MVRHYVVTLRWLPKARLAGRRRQLDHRLAPQPKFTLANKHGVWQEKVIQAEIRGERETKCFEEPTAADSYCSDGMFADANVVCLSQPGPLKVRQYL